MIRQDDLEHGVWYSGEGRCGGAVALWHGRDKLFRSVDYSCGIWIVAEMEYGRGFVPMHKITEG